MAFIVKKNIRGKDYYYLNENKRVEGKVKTKTLAYLGKTREEAEVKKEEFFKRLTGDKEIMENKDKNRDKDKNKTKDRDTEKSKKENVELNQNQVHQKISMEEIASFCRRKGFVYPSAEIYGGLAGFWDFGHLGVELNNNLKKDWWSSQVHKRKDVVGIDGSIITNPKVWEASGHVTSFIDVAVLNKKTKEKLKIDKHQIKNYEKNPDFEIKGEFNPMFTSNVGPIEGDSLRSYLRPETAQLIFTNFKFVQDNARMKLPFGIAQIGKAFRNEIAPRDFLFRSREFEQMELQYFVDSDEINECPDYEKIKNKKIKILNAEKKEMIFSIDEMLQKNIFKNKWHAYWLHNSYQWFLDLGINEKNLRLREHEKNELAHYANAAIDIEYNFPNGWTEIFGSHDRGEFDLLQHEKFSKKDLKFFDEEKKKKILPRVIESSFGLGRAFLVLLFDSYFYDEKRKNIVLKLNSKLSPIKISIFPIIKKENYEKISEEVFNTLSKEWNVFYDKSGSIGRRYARNDEIGTPFCITIDEESLKNKDVTIRERDTAKQIRVKISDLKNILRDLINQEIKFDDAGKKFN